MDTAAVQGTEEPKGGLRECACSDFTKRSTGRAARAQSTAAPRVRPSLLPAAPAWEAALLPDPRPLSSSSSSSSSETCTEEPVRHRALPGSPGRRPPGAGGAGGWAPAPSSAPLAPSPLHSEPAPGSRERLQPRSRLGAVPGIAHYLPQANVARDGQSEGQCNVLHGLSHGSVQNPANTEVPPTAEPGGGGGGARPLRQPGRATARRGGGRENALSKRAAAEAVPFLPSIKNMSTCNKNFLRCGNC